MGNEPSDKSKIGGCFAIILWLAFFIIADNIFDDKWIHSWKGFVFLIPTVLIPLFMFGPLSPPRDRDNSIFNAILYFMGCIISLICGRLMN